VLYSEFKDTVKSDLTLGDLLSDIPLAIQLADPQRVAYYQISWDEVTQWLMPGRAKTIVLLPNRETLLDLIQEAVAFIMSPAPYSDLAATLQFHLTMVSESSATHTPTPSLAPEFMASITATSIPGTATITPTVTRTPTVAGYPFPPPYP
jgi:hypothetical protein